MAQRFEHDDRQAPFRRLEAQIRTIQVKLHVRVETQWRIPGHDQQQFVKGRNPRGQFRAIVKHSAAIDDPADSLGRQGRPRCFSCGSHTVISCDSDRPESVLRLMKLFGELHVPVFGQENVLVQAGDPLALAACKANV